MERRYLAATLALAATFAIFSGEFCTRYLSKIPRTSNQVKADVACAKHYVAQQIMAKLQPYLDRDAERRPVLAQLGVPLVPPAPAALVAPGVSKCPLQRLQRKETQPEIRINLANGDLAKQLTDINVVRAELLSDRAQEWQVQMNEHQMEINLQQIQHAQEISAHAMERAQREMERSRHKAPVPGNAIHINFVAPTVTVTPPAVPTPASF